jgi:hypothetical protein
MKFSLNTKQLEALSSFFFGIAKGLILGTLGLSMVVPQIDIFIKIWLIISSFILAFACIMIGLDLLRR